MRRMRAPFFVVLVVGVAGCARSSSSAAVGDAAPSGSASASGSGKRKPAGKTHAEIKGAIRHVKGGARTLEAGGKGELDPVHAFWGTSPTDVYAAAWDDPGRGLLHTKGDGVWTHEDLRDRRLRGVWASGPSDVYASGHSGIYHRKGHGAWVHEATSRGATFAMWGSGAKDVYAVGAYGEIHRSTGNGTWKTTSLPGKSDVILLAIWGSGANDVYTGGQSADGTIFHSTGKDDWTAQTIPAKGGITSIFGFGPKDVYAVAHSLYHSTGDGTWEKVAVPGLESGQAVCGDAHGDLYVGGRDGDLFVRKNGEWSSTRDKGAGTYQALFCTGEEVYIGSEIFLEWTEPDDDVSDGGR